MAPFEAMAEWMAKEAVKTPDPSSTLAKIGRAIYKGETDPIWAKAFLSVYAKACRLAGAAKQELG